LEANNVPVGFIITKIDDKVVSSPKEVAEMLNGRKGRVTFEGTIPQEPGSKYYFRDFIR
jgi:hypothetical protein